MSNPEYARVAAAALAAATTLLPQWMGGKRQGREWVGERRINGGPGDSWSVNLSNGVWACFASGARGHDMIGLYAELNNLSQGAAMQAIREQVGENSRGVPVLATALPPEPPENGAEPIPDDAPEIIPHPSMGVPSAVYRYGNALRVTRFDLADGSKQFMQWTWRGGRWVSKGYNGQLPVFHVERLARHQEAQVLVVEGEKCALAAQELLPSWVVVTWAGGAYAHKKTDWSSLAGRDVLIWPDADAPGHTAAAQIAATLSGKAKRVRVVKTNGQAPGWDVVDAIKEGWDRAKIIDWVKEHISEPVQLSDKPTHVPVVIPEEARIQLVSDADDDSAPISWSSMGLDLNPAGWPHPTLANASSILQMHRNFKNKIWYDEFRGQVYHITRSAVPTPWTDADTRRMTVQIQQGLKLSKFTLSLVQEAIVHAAEAHAKHSLKDWLKSLNWDGTPRLENWLVDCLGVERNEYTEAISRNWPVAMIARAFQPGSKMDNMPVLEGISGINKTQFLEVLGGEWYEALPTEFGSKDFLQALQGVWLAEIPDMTGFTRADHSAVIAILTIRNDKYRKSYGRLVEKFPRTTVFAATSETDDYLTDTKGRRRYWPLRCRDIDLDALHYQRDNIFAEAICKYREGMRWYEMPSSSEQEQLQRVNSDPWSDRVLDYASYLWEKAKLSAVTIHVTTSKIMSDGLDIPLNQQGRREEIRVGLILRAGGWIKTRDQDHRYWKKVERIT